MSGDAFRPFRERVAEDEAQVIAFRLGGELHACDIQLVEEVVTKRRVHRLPDMPPRLMGMLRLRGELVPVLDVAPLLDLALQAEQPAILVVGMGEARLGVAVDAAQDVVALTPADYRPAPLTGGDRDQFVVGVARLDGTLVSLIDLAEMLREAATAA
ncbi:chemotaxis protein CheW [Longimicrobium sp.]|uniref:chemotaxis protein CheW n=1 Tax=Longimicrobium sp. TaxID=2029185 RepID=UPI002BA990E4|nr:chemotaxis protein CheW [Longimicrobium sp.]HSU17910.1 chemotaxis protein CheW [Longimicrobium sp.]